MQTRVKLFLGLFPFLAACATSAELELGETTPTPFDADEGGSVVDGSAWTGNVRDANAATPEAEAGAIVDSGSEGSTAPECDSRFSFSTSTPKAGKPFTAEFTDDIGYVYVFMEALGPGQPNASWNGVTGEGPFTWSYLVEGHAAGTLELVFLKNKQETTSGKKVASCSLEISP